MLKRNRRLITAAPAALLAFAVGTPAMAQGAGAEIEEIVVTARKREESLQDVPVAVTALTGQQAERQGVRSVADLSRIVPSLSTGTSQNSSSAVTFILRGQSASDIILTIDQSVGLYADGAYIPRPYGLAAGLVDLASIEVVKGPQGTLYGRNTTGGAINLISKAPDSDGLHGFVYGELGNHEDRRLTAAVNVPIIPDVLSARLAYQNWNREGYGRSRFTDQDLGGDRNQQYLRASLRYEPTASVRFDLKSDWTRIRENGQLTTPRFYAPQAATNYQAAVELGLDPTVPANLATAQAAIQQTVALGNADFFTSSSELPLHEDIDGYSFNLTSTFDLSESVSLKSISSYRHLEQDKQTDLDGTQFHILELVTHVPTTVPFRFDLAQDPMVKDRLLTQEFDLAGTLFDNRLNWLVGAFYSDEKGRDATQNDFRLNQFFGQNAAPLRNFVINYNEGLDIKNRSLAFFTQNDFQITSQLSVTAGYRYTKEKRELTSALRRYDPFNNLWRCGHPSLAGLITPLESACFVKLPQDSDSGASYLLSLNYKPSSDILLYARTARGFRGGGFQLRTPTAPNFAPEVAEDIEVGLKADFFDRRLRANLAAYRTNYKNKQESQIVAVPIQGNATIITNAAQARIRGFEAELFAKPVAALSLRAAVSYIHGEYKKYPGALRYAGGTPIDASGERFAYPPWTVSMTARYEVPVGPGDLGLQADWSWTDHARPPPRLVDPAIPTALTDSFVSQGPGGRNDLGLLNLRIDYALEDKGLTFSVFATNALDKHYQAPAIAQPNTGGIAQGITGEPRMWGIAVRKTFGGE